MIRQWLTLANTKNVTVKFSGCHIETKLSSTLNVFHDTVFDFHSLGSIFTVKPPYFFYDFSKNPLFKWYTWQVNRSLCLQSNLSVLIVGLELTHFTLFKALLATQRPVQTVPSLVAMYRTGNALCLSLGYFNADGNARCWCFGEKWFYGTVLRM